MLIARELVTDSQACPIFCSLFWHSEDDAGMMGLAGGDSEVHPYVSLTVNLSG